MLDDVDLPWPRCLGTFDEESCRYFLHETGTRVVPRYPFSFGMEEVYGLILEKYGFSSTPDVTSLLEQLLEDDQISAGLGDDGDVWRSWRHGWRHRNDDILNPFIPRFGSIILQPSTPRRIRALKTSNFTQKYDEGLIPNEKPGSHLAAGPHEVADQKEEGCCPETQTLGHSSELDRGGVRLSHQIETQRTCNEVLPLSCEIKSVHSQCTTRPLSAAEADPTLSVLFQMLESDPCGSAQLRGGERAATITCESELASQERVSNFNNQQCSPASITMAAAHESSVDISSATSNEIVASSSNVYSLGKDLDTINEEHNFLREADPHSKCDILPRHASTRSKLPNPVVQETSCSGTVREHSATSPGHQKRAAHREARLIDGTIFTSKVRRSKPVSQHSNCISSSLDIANTRSSGCLGWSPTKRSNSLHNNWTGELRQLFHRKRKDKQSFDNPKHRSVPCSQKRDASDPLSTAFMASDQLLNNHTGITSFPARSRFGLDGAAEVPSPYQSPVNLNKPLPLSPDEIVKSMSSRSLPTSSAYFDNTPDLPSTSSTTSSVSRTSSKKEPHGQTRGLSHIETMGPHELPPIREVDLDNKQYIDPAKSPTLPASPISYTSVAQGNPFSEKQVLHSPPRPPPLDFSRLRRGEHLAISETDTTRTEPTQEPSTQIKQSDNYFSSLSWFRTTSPETPPESVDHSRGRKKPVPSSSSKAENDQLPPKTPTKRPSSPLKRFLGLTRSGNINKFEEPETPPRPVTPGNSKKDSLKKWGDRFRYGFLTPDQEQLRQEELIEAHNNTSASSTPQQSTFPVSLEPPIQAKIQSEIELIMTVTANRYLLREARAGRLSAESVAKTKDLWEKMNRPQVVEFHYDQITQHNLVMANLDRVKLYGDASKDAILINSTMRGWKTMAREMSIRTFCSPDSVIRKHLHDAHRVLELLGAPFVTFLAYEDMQLKTLTKINQRQKERMERRAGSTGRNISSSSHMDLAHRRNASEGSYQQAHYEQTDYPITALQMDKISLSPSPTPISRTKVRKATGAEGAIMSLPTNFERSRDGYTSHLKNAKMGKSMREI